MHVPTRELSHQLLLAMAHETKPQLLLNLRRSTRPIFIAGTLGGKVEGKWRGEGRGGDGEKEKEG